MEEHIPVPDAAAEHLAIVLRKLEEVFAACDEDGAGRVGVERLVEHLVEELAEELGCQVGRGEEVSRSTSGDAEGNM